LTYSDHAPNIPIPVDPVCHLATSRLNLFYGRPDAAGVVAFNSSPDSRTVLVPLRHLVHPTDQG
jgi:hypothetical protein